MMKRVKVFHSENCPFCKKLTEGLDKLKITFEEIDVDSKDGEKEFLKLYKFTKSENIPIVIVDNQVLIPQISFNTIEEALISINKLYLIS